MGYFNGIFSGFRIDDVPKGNLQRIFPMITLKYLGIQPPCFECLVLHLVHCLIVFLEALVYLLLFIQVIAEFVCRQRLVFLIVAVPLVVPRRDWRLRPLLLASLLALSLPRTKLEEFPRFIVCKKSMSEGN